MVVKVILIYKCKKTLQQCIRFENLERLYHAAVTSFRVQV